VDVDAGQALGPKKTRWRKRAVQRECISFATAVDANNKEKTKTPEPRNERGHRRTTRRGEDAVMPGEGNDWSEKSAAAVHKGKLWRSVSARQKKHAAGKSL